MEENIYEVYEQETEQKMTVKDRIASVLETTKDFVEDHSEGILYTIFYGGLTVLFGQTIHYMHLLNKHARKGQFFTGNFR